MKDCSMVSEFDKAAFKIILFQPEIAQNLGTILRLCTCFGVSLDVIEPCGFPFSSKALKRAMMDYGELTSVTRHISFQKYCDKKMLSGQESRMILLTTKGSECIWDFDFNQGDNLIFGNEGHGVPNFVVEKANAKVFIPMPGGGRSLNLAVSVGISVSEVSRQLRTKKRDLSYEENSFEPS